MKSFLSSFFMIKWILTHPVLIVKINFENKKLHSCKECLVWADAMIQEREVKNRKHNTQLTFTYSTWAGGSGGEEGTSLWLLCTWAPPFGRCLVNRQYPWKKTLIERTYFINEQIGKLAKSSSDKLLSTKAAQSF